MRERGEMRAADSDRQAVAERLRIVVDEGRLDLHEYDERLRAAYGSKTYAELDGLVADLPVSVLAGRVGSGPTVDGLPSGSLLPGRRWRCPGATRGWLAENWTAYLSVVGLATAGWAIFSVMGREPLYFWPLWVAGPWGVVLLVATIGGLLRGKPRRVARRWARKEAARDRGEKAARARRQGVESVTGGLGTGAESVSGGLGTGAGSVAGGPSASAGELAEQRRWGSRDDWQLGGRAD
ncbi:DUF1707 domain-containing protein [Micromonospora sp. NPDC050397]|uniref:DUF1707 SHOCT-like domain-containing protein n=1 Tax=Micromonospora sp. NPDC050397 TaxID=3364279 RepID=UPI00384C1399